MVEFKRAVSRYVRSWWSDLIIFDLDLQRDSRHRTTKSKRMTDVTSGDDSNQYFITDADVWRDVCVACLKEATSLDQPSSSIFLVGCCGFSPSILLLDLVRADSLTSSSLLPARQERTTWYLYSFQSEYSSIMGLLLSRTTCPAVDDLGNELGRIMGSEKVRMTHFLTLRLDSSSEIWTEQFVFVMISVKSVVAINLQIQKNESGRIESRRSSDSGKSRSCSLGDFA